MHLGEQDRCAVIVVQRVHWRVGRVEAVPYHRRLMAYRVHFGQQFAQQRCVGQLATDEPVPCDVVRRQAGAVRLWEEVVQQHHLASGVGQEVGHMGTDEPGAAGH